MSVNQNNSNSESSEVILTDNINDFEQKDDSSTEEEPIDYNIDEVAETLEEVNQTSTESSQEIVTEEVVVTPVEQETNEVLEEVVTEKPESVIETTEVNNTQEDDDELYVITINNVPYFYEKDLIKTQENLKRIAQIYCDLSSLSMDYDEDEGELNIVEKTNFLFFNISTNKYRLKIHKVEKFKLEGENYD